MAAEKQHPGRANLAVVNFQTAITAFIRLWTSPFKGSKGAPTYFKDVAYAALRTQFSKLSYEQFRYLSPSTEEAYRAVCKAHKATPDSITLEDGSQAHWIGKRNAENLIVYFHGGGYYLPANPGHFEYLFSLGESLRAAGHDTTIVVLGYSLAPENPYPTQLRQAVGLLKYLLELKQWDPSKISIGGDSAGGNLTLAVLSHCVHPHPQIEPLQLSSPLRSAILISPWVSFNTSISSFTTNLERDYLGPRVLKKWSTAFLGGATSGDNYSEPFRAPSSWWKGMEKAVSEVLIWAGEWEIILDGILAFSNTFRDGYGGKCDVILGEKGAHIEMIMHRILGYKDKSHSERVVEGWVKARL